MERKHQSRNLLPYYDSCNVPSMDQECARERDGPTGYKLHMQEKGREILLIETMPCATLEEEESG